MSVTHGKPGFLVSWPPPPSHKTPLDTRLASLSITDLYVRLQATQAGLTSEEAAVRMQREGRNEFVGQSARRRLLQVLRPFANPLVAILLVAAVAAAVLGEVTDAVLITTIVLLSSALNTWQTYKSNRAVKSLQKTMAPTATVRRDGEWREILRRDIVTGDVVHLAAGDLVPADVRLLETNDLHVQQAALTGESLPVDKVVQDAAIEDAGPESAGLAYLGTSVVSGSGTALVFAVGDATAFGDIVERLASRPAETEFERGIRHFSMLILQTVLFLVLFILIVNIAMGRDAFQSLLFTVALAVGLTPEFLPMITTVTLAQGAVQMAKDHVIVKHLPAIQNLGSIDVLCSDKTGTLTAGAISLSGTLDAFGAASDDTLRLGALNARYETGVKSPLDTAILARRIEGLGGYAKTDEIPFDFERRRVSVVVAEQTHDVKKFLFITKGAPEGVLAICSNYESAGRAIPFDAAARDHAKKTYCDLSRHGLRVLAVAYKNVAEPIDHAASQESELTLAGYLTFADPILPGVGATLAELRRDGIRVKILTGDNELVTGHVCAQVGFEDGSIVLGSDIERMDDAALAQVVETTDVFARVSPAQKNRIIRALKVRGHVVGFLGDGINDAPSLHDADVGISVAGAVDIAREASDIILLKPGLDVLHRGIMAGRKAFANVLKYLLMGTSSNFGNMFSMAGATLFLPFLPMLPTQILLNNFLYDLAQVTIPTDNIDEAYVRKPQRWNIGLIRTFMITIGPVSSVFDGLTFFAMLSLFKFGETMFHTGWFVESLATQCLVLFIIRTAGRPWRSRPSLPLAITTIAVVLIGMTLPYLPVASVLGFKALPSGFFLFLLPAIGVYLAIVELVKRRCLRRFL